MAVDPNGLSRIPRVRPTELCSISLAEKVAALEAQLQVVVSDHKCIVANLEARMTSIETMAQLPEKPTFAEVASNLKTGAPKPPVVSSGTQSILAVPPPAAKKLQPVPVLQVEGSNLRPSEYGSQRSLSSLAPSGHNEGFMYTGQQKKLMKKHKKSITGQGAPGLGSKLKGAPEPSRDVFVYRVQKGVEAKDIQDHMAEQNIQIRDVKMISNEEAKFCSFKVEIKLSDYDTVVDSAFWPEGIRVRRYYKPRPKSTLESWD